MNYLVFYLFALTFLTPAWGQNAFENCVTNQVEGYAADALDVESIQKFQSANDWKRRYSSFFTPDEGKSALLESGPYGSVLSLQTIQAMNTLKVTPRDHAYTIVMKAKVREVSGEPISDSVGIFLQNVFFAGKALTHQSEPTSQQIYDAIKNAR